MIWLTIPVIAVLISLLVLHEPVDEFKEVTRRNRALKALGKLYSPANDTVLKGRKRAKEG